MDVTSRCLVYQADTHKQDGGSWNISASLKNLAKAGWDAISSFGFGVKGGDSSKVEEGHAYFDCPGVEVLERITITAEEYDRRYGVNLTKHITPDGEAASAFAPAYSGTLELGENSVGFEIPNVMIPGQRTETTSQQITRKEAEQAALEAARKAEEEKRAAEAEEERKKRQQVKVDAIKADAAAEEARVLAEAAAEREREAAQRQREAAEAAQRAAEEAAKKKPEPGALPAVASGRPLAPRRAAAVLDEIDRQKSAK